MSEDSLLLKLSQSTSQQDMFDDPGEDATESLPHGQKHFHFLETSIKRDFGLGNSEDDDSQYGKDLEEREKEENDTSGEDLDSSKGNKSDSEEGEEGNVMSDAQEEVPADEGDKENKIGEQINVVMKESPKKSKQNTGVSDSEDSEDEERNPVEKSKPEIKEPHTGEKKNGDKGKEEMKITDKDVEVRKDGREMKAKEIMGTIKELEKKKEKLKKEIEEQSTDVEEANGKLQFRKFRMESLKEKKEEQEKEIKEQKDVMKRKKKEIIEVGSQVMEGVEERSKRIRLALEEMSSNVSRVAGGKTKAAGEIKDESKIITLKMIQTSGKQLIIFMPEEMQIENALVREELAKIDNITITPYKESDMMDLIKKVKSCSPEEDCVAVHFLRWSAGDKIDDDEVMDMALSSLMMTLNLAIEKGKIKFVRQMLVVPPSMEMNLKAMEKLEGKISQENKGQDNVVNLLQFQKELGKMWEKKEDKVWNKEGVARAKILCETNKGEASEYALRRLLSEVAVKICNNGNPLEICLECGLIHEEDQCIQETANDLEEKKDPVKKHQDLGDKEAKKKEKRSRGSSGETGKKKKKSKSEGKNNSE